MAKTFQGLATEMLAAIETKTRANGDAFYCLKQGSPAWMDAIVLAAHGDMMPDDWRYLMIHNALVSFADNARNIQGEVSCDLVAMNDHQYCLWLASHGDRRQYVNDAMAEFGPSHNIMTIIAMGFEAESVEVYELVEAELIKLEEDDET